ncbi:ALDH-like protein [Clathrospora elynae]|uniref:ALDH-like protein n=1 Tax=Clathrospora elynae TaxID=706981 RepID=A0A6A5SNH1_9PLEO|nr:ALDH-like protein [Clathrospora elynae]
MCVAVWCGRQFAGAGLAVEAQLWLISETTNDVELPTKPPTPHRDSTSTTNLPLWINNEAVHTSSTIPVTQATSAPIVHHASSASVKDATKAANTSWTAFKSWRTTTHVFRRDLILCVAAYFELHAEDFVAWQIEETSCTETWAKQNVTLSLSFPPHVSYLKEIAAQVSSVTGVIPPTEKPNTIGFVFKEPIGPILCIAPWNAALVLATRGIASAIAVGCTVVFKASELCPKTHLGITHAFTSSSAPPGVLNQIQCRREDAAEITETLIAHDSIRKIEFIGSAALGGKCPALVLDDADLQEAANQCALGAVLHHGQICFSTERIIVFESVAELPARAGDPTADTEDFQDLLIKAMQGLGEKGVAGSAVSEGIAAHASDIIRDAQDHGDSVLVGAISSNPPTLSLNPTIIRSPSSSSRILDEETFGPSASLYIVSSDAEAITLANSSAYGLNATVWTRDMSRFLAMSRELEYGQVHANSISVYTSPTASQGGVKGSGFGRQNGRWGLEEFVVDKFVSWCG